jgi:hypothetical protein
MSIGRTSLGYPYGNAGREGRPGAVPVSRPAGFCLCGKVIKGVQGMSGSAAQIVEASFLISVWPCSRTRLFMVPGMETSAKMNKRGHAAPSRWFAEHDSCHLEIEAKLSS